LPEGLWELELTEWQPSSYASAQTWSSNEVLVTRLDSKPTLSLPDHTEVPPAPLNVVATAALRDTSQGSQWEIQVTWAPAPSTFVRGYRVYCSAGGQNRVIGEYGRNATGCQFWAFAVGVQHTVTVTAVSNTGKESSGTSATVTPGSSLPSISAMPVIYYRTKIPFSFGASAVPVYCGIRCDLSWSASGADYCELFVNGALVVRTPGSGFACSLVDGLYETSGMPSYGIAVNSGDSITIRACKKDGTCSELTRTVPSPTEKWFISWPNGTYGLPIGDGTGLLRPVENVAGTFSLPSNYDSFFALLGWAGISGGNVQSPGFKRVAYKVFSVDTTQNVSWTPSTSGTWIFLLDAAAAKGSYVTNVSTTSNSFQATLQGGYSMRVLALEVA
jgi:hypothetical protein